MKEFLTTNLTSSEFPRALTMFGKLWWNIKAKTLSENKFIKDEKLKAPPSEGVKFFTPSLKNKKMAPNINMRIDNILIPIIKTWITFVLSMLLKLNIAPERKKSKTQNQNYFKTFTYVKTPDIILPVIMHLDTDVPSR